MSAEKLYKMFGSTTSPSADRESMMALVQKYVNICVKMKMLDVLEEKILEALAVHPEITIATRWDYDDHMNQISVEPDDYDLMEPIIGVLESVDIRYFIVKTEGLLVVNQANLANIKKLMFSDADYNLYQSVENYEKNLLSSAITSKNTSKISKI